MAQPSPSPGGGFRISSNLVLTRSCSHCSVSTMQSRNSAANLAAPSQPTRRAAALAAGYALVPVPAILRLRETANSQRRESRKAGAR